MFISRSRLQTPFRGSPRAAGQNALMQQTEQCVQTHRLGWKHAAYSPLCPAALARHFTNDNISDKLQTHTMPLRNHEEASSVNQMVSIFILQPEMLQCLKFSLEAFFQELQWFGSVLEQHLVKRMIWQCLSWNDWTLGKDQQSTPTGWSSCIPWFSQGFNLPQIQPLD